MTQADDLQRLVERIEAATGPDRALNADILRYLGWTQDGSDAVDPEGNRAHSIPDYTGSIDAAMSLVPEYLHTSMTDDPDDLGGVVAELWSAKSNYWVNAATFPLALTSVALRARITQEQSNG